MTKKVLVLPGDGIGRDVIHACEPILEYFSNILSCSYGDIGWKFWKDENDPIPKRTWHKIKESDAILIGATTSYRESGYVSPLIQLRNRLDLFANVRPIRHLVDDGKKYFEFYLIRENVEGLYSGLDFYNPSEPLNDLIKSYGLIKENDKFGVSIRLLTLSNTERLLRFSAQWALDHKKRKITIADKPNVFRESSKIWDDAINKISKEYPSIIFEVKNVDAVAMWIVKSPEKFEVVVAENHAGDILSDVGAAVMGGLGYAYSGNFGENGCNYFEPVHGSAPTHVGKNDINPTAMFLTISMMLNYLGFNNESSRLDKAIRLINKGNKKYLTYDVGGLATTLELAKRITEKVKE